MIFFAGFCSSGEELVSISNIEQDSPCCGVCHLAGRCARFPRERPPSLRNVHSRWHLTLGASRYRKRCHSYLVPSWAVRCWRTEIARIPSAGQRREGPRASVNRLDLCVTRDEFKALVEGSVLGSHTENEEAADASVRGLGTPAAPPASQHRDTDENASSTPASVHSGGQENEDAEEEERSGSRQPPEHDDQSSTAPLPLLHRRQTPWSTARNRAGFQPTITPLSNPSPQPAPNSRPTARNMRAALVHRSFD